MIVDLGHNEMEKLLNNNNLLNKTIEEAYQVLLNFLFPRS